MKNVVVPELSLFFLISFLALEIRQKYNVKEILLHMYSVLMALSAYGYNFK